MFAHLVPVCGTKVIAVITRTKVQRFDLGAKAKKLQPEARHQSREMHSQSGVDETRAKLRRVRVESQRFTEHTGKAEGGWVVGF